MSEPTDYVKQIREWVAGDLYPDHDTFTFSREFGAGLIAQIDVLEQELAEAIQDSWS